MNHDEIQREALKAAEEFVYGLTHNVEPNGCMQCGASRRSHGTRWLADAGMHQWIEPSDAVRLARMRNRRGLREALVKVREEMGTR